VHDLPSITRVSLTFAAAALLACTPGDGDTGDSGESDIDACIDPGTELLPHAKPVLPPTSQSDPMYTCTTGWGTDAPRLAPAWTQEIRAASIDFTSPTIVAHPDGGVIVAATGEFGHYDANGELLWSNVINDGPMTSMQLAVEEAGTILLGIHGETLTSLLRHGADGTIIGEIAIPWNSGHPAIRGVATFGTDIVIAAQDFDEQGSYESTLLRLDADGNLVWRTSSDQVIEGNFAVSGSGVALFGRLLPFSISLDDGTVLGTLTPTNGIVVSAAGLGDGFIVAGILNNATGDLGIGRYSSTGVEQWLQTYDRATLGDAGWVVAAGGDGSSVVGGSTTRLEPAETGLQSQPVVFGVDADGNASWTDRIAAHASTSAVAIGVDGDVYVAGVAAPDVEVPPGEMQPQLIWLRRYVP
jgi:hypothetical protein